ncbi:MAG TPA: aminodeoxychorismate/anthranilate synthase component II [Archaeoglobaceae archaeon]|nr:aminodeoxychorismate/anthranilate synthase component II [Archaeoglobaceae archaeon]
MILIIDNKDSFVWNLAEYASFFDRIKVFPNTITLEKVKIQNPDGIIISPGPGSPEKKRDIGNCPEIIRKSEIPILGVCLGHQTIAYVFGGEIKRVKPVHGKTSVVKHDGKTIFSGIRNPLVAGRYHSLAVTEVPKGFEVSAVSEDGIIMGIRNRDRMIEGVQFHPESVLTEDGLKIIKNWVKNVC